MKNPWMKFYPADWRADPALRSCSIAARGLWIEMLAIMHDAMPYGSLLVNGQRIDKKRMSVLCGVSERECSELMLELEGVGVFSRDEDGTIYSRRMRRDAIRSEEGRRQIAKRWNGREPSSTPIRSPNRSDDRPPTAKPITQKLEARSQKLDNSETNVSGSATEAEVYRFGRKLLGKNAGGVITELRKHCRYDHEAVMDILRQAEEKDVAMEWLQGVLKGTENAKPSLKEIFPDEIYENVL